LNRCRTVWLALLHLEHPGLSVKSIPARRREVGERCLSRSMP
jgi:hypothetical protein